MGAVRFHGQASRLTFHLLGVTAFIATLSYAVQSPGLSGASGIAPATQTLAWLRAQGAGFFDAPSLLWVSNTEGVFRALVWGSVVCSLAMAVGIYPRVTGALTYVAWLSLVSVGSPFLQFQWDILLAETLAIAALFGDRGRRFALAFLAFKVTFCSGLVKLLSGDESWRDLSALTYHFWTQPLPTWTSYVFDALPLGVNKALCAVMFALELVAPFFLFLSGKGRFVGIAAVWLLQGGLALAGNYSYFNLLAAVLVVPLLAEPVPRSSRSFGDVSALGGNVLLVALSAYAFSTSWLGLREESVPGARVAQALRPFHLGAVYGAFAVMTKTRREIVLEGTSDGVTWVPYGFPWKPGPIEERPAWVAPWQPRLDWQMWFAALSSCERQSWLWSLQRHLLLGTPDVLALFSGNPFPGKAPKAVRALSYQYRFAPLSQKGVWWQRTFEGPFCPTLDLSAFSSIASGATVP